MSRSLVVAGLGFTIILIGGSALMLHPPVGNLFIVGIPSGHGLVAMISAMSFVVAAVIDQDR